MKKKRDFPCLRMFLRSKLLSDLLLLPFFFLTLIRKTSWGSLSNFNFFILTAIRLLKDLDQPYTYQQSKSALVNVMIFENVEWIWF